MGEQSTVQITIEAVRPTSTSLVERWALAAGVKYGADDITRSTITFYDASWGINDPHVVDLLDRITSTGRFQYVAEDAGNWCWSPYQTGWHPDMGTVEVDGSGQCAKCDCYRSAHEPDTRSKYACDEYEPVLDQVPATRERPSDGEGQPLMSEHQLRTAIDQVDPDDPAALAAVLSGHFTDDPRRWIA